MVDFAAQRYALIALAAAALFGASTPFSKLLLGEASPQMLGGLLYLGSGLGLSLIWVARFLSMRTSRRSSSRSLSRITLAQLRQSELPWLAGAVLCGGILAPVLLLWGLSGISAASASLLLNAEAVLTTLLAALFFAEHVGRRIWLASMLMLIAGGFLSWSPGGSGLSGMALTTHVMAVVAACLLWAVDNNLTRHVAAADAVTIALIKGLVAGSVNLALSLAAGAAMPSLAPLAGALVLGATGYGASLALYVVALRNLGTARTGAHFATAPFFGAVLAIAMGEPVTSLFALALALMVLATWLVLTESHQHPHQHAPLRHAHTHVHDEHHHHSHDALDDAAVMPERGHVHEHEHAPLTHAHTHMPDLHHRHRH